jgi:hypothetical protein
VQVRNQVDAILQPDWQPQNAAPGALFICQSVMACRASDWLVFRKKPVCCLLQAVHRGDHFLAKDAAIWFAKIYLKPANKQNSP